MPVAGLCRARLLRFACSRHSLAAAGRQLTHHGHLQNGHLLRRIAAGSTSLGRDWRHQHKGRNTAPKKVAKFRPGSPVASRPRRNESSFGFDDTPSEDEVAPHGDHDALSSRQGANSSEYEESENKTPEYKRSRRSKAPDFKNHEETVSEFTGPENTAPGYIAPEYESLEYEFPDYKSAPEYESPEYKSPEYEPADNESPEYESPDYKSAAECESPESKPPRLQLKLESPISTVAEDEKQTNSSPGNTTGWTAVDWRRWHAENKVKKFKPCSFPKHTPLSSKPDYLTPGVKLSEHLKIKRDIYAEWGFYRHQLDADQVLRVRRSFKQWKLKYLHVLNPVNPDSWPWRDEGRWLFKLGSMSEMQTAWEVLDANRRQEIWPHVVLSTMHLCPDRAATVLAATMDPLPPGYAIHDVLSFLANRLDFEAMPRSENRLVRAEEMLLLATRCIKEMPPGHVHLKQRTLGVLCRKLPIEQASELYAALKETKHHLHANTKLQLAAKLARHLPHKDAAFDLIKEVVDAGININETRVSSVITLLLFQDPSTASASPRDEQPRDFSPRHMLQYFIERGFSPNVATATALVNTLCQQQQVDEAVRLALLFMDCGIELNVRSWATLFHGAKVSLVADNIARALDVSRRIMIHDVDVLNNLLHAIFYFANMELRSGDRHRPFNLPLFATVLRLYARRFDLEPLRYWLPDTFPDYMDETRLQQASTPGHGPVGDAPLVEEIDAESQLIGAEGQSINTESQPPDAGSQPIDAESQPVADQLTEMAKSPITPSKNPWQFEKTVVPIAQEYYSNSPAPHQPPISTTLSIMVRCFIRSLNDTEELVSYYMLFASRLKQPHTTTITPLVSRHASLIHDTLITVMMEHRSLAHYALRVFGDMIHDNATSSSSSSSPPSFTSSVSFSTSSTSSPTSSSTSSSTPSSTSPSTSTDTPKPALHPAPSRFTYNILLNCLLSRSKDGRVLAERVLGLMHLHGIRPDRKTWNILIRGYANRQDVSSVVAALHDMGAAGFLPDLFTYHAFASLANKQEALSMINESLRGLSAPVVDPALPP